jgi:hypothetical protein
MTGSDDSRPPPQGLHAGLVNRPAHAKYPRPAGGLGPSAPVRAPSRTFEPIALETHRDLIRHQAEIAARIAAEPQVSVMLLINPVLGMEQVGVRMSPEIARHVLHTIQHPTGLRTRRDELEEKLREALGEPPRPTDPAWNAHLLFELRKLPPLEIGAQVPAYAPPLGQEEGRKLHALRPAGGVRYPQPRLLPPRARVSSVPWKESLRRIDLAAPAPECPRAHERPAAVPLEDLWFYKDLDALVHDALEFGVIQRRAFPIHTPDSFRQILDGRKANSFSLWIDRMGFKPEPRR